MTRIVAGAAKGRRLAVPAKGTRPTSGRAREALFNSLLTLLDLDGARVLDLFAGTGAVGLEALSRGASVATLVDSDRGAVDVLRRNAETVGLPGADVRRDSVERFLAGPGEPYDFVFLDPPYALADDELAAMLVAVSDRWLSAGAVVVVERAARGAQPSWPTSVTPLRERRYGEGVLWYGRAR